MNILKYQSGGLIKAGDQIKYLGERGVVEFVVAEKTGDEALDWYFDEYGGGIMIKTDSLGNVFLDKDDLNDSLVFVDREIT